MAIKNILLRNKQNIWLCKQITDTTWDNPKKYSMNVMRVNANGEIEAFGSTFPENLVCICTKNVSKNFQENKKKYSKYTINLLYSIFQ